MVHPATHGESTASTAAKTIRKRYLRNRRGGEGGGGGGGGGGGEAWWFGRERYQVLASSVSTGCVMPLTSTTDACVPEVAPLAHTGSSHAAALPPAFWQLVSSVHAWRPETCERQRTWCMLLRRCWSGALGPLGRAYIAARSW